MSIINKITNIFPKWLVMALYLFIVLTGIFSSISHTIPAYAQADAALNFSSPVRINNDPRQCTTDVKYCRTGDATSGYTYYSCLTVQTGSKSGTVTSYNCGSPLNAVPVKDANQTPNKLVELKKKSDSGELQKEIKAENDAKASQLNTPQTINTSKLGKVENAQCDYTTGVCKFTKVCTEDVATLCKKGESVAVYASGCKADTARTSTGKGGAVLTSNTAGICTGNLVKASDITSSNPKASDIDSATNKVSVADTKASVTLEDEKNAKEAADRKNDGGIFAWIANIVLGLLTLLLWLAIQFAKFVLGVMGGMFVVLVSINPASNELLNVAYRPWQSVVNISNIFLIAGIIFMGFGYILNLDFIKKSQGLQNFFLGLLTIGVMMQFTFAASAGVVNFTNGVGNIIYFGAGGLAQPSVAPAGSKLAECLSKIDKNGDSGIGFVNTFVCNVSQISKITSADAAAGDGLNAVFDQMFKGKGSTAFVTTAIALAIFILAIFSFWKVLVILLVRIFGLWILIVISPLALVAAFSPLPQMKEISSKWLDNFMRLSFSYPFYTFGITLVTLMIGSVSTAIQESAKQSGFSAVPDGSIDTYAQGVTGAGAAVGNVIGNFVAFDAELIVLVIIATFSLGLVWGFGVLFTKIFGAIYDAVAKAAGTAWKYGGKQLVGGAASAFNAGIRQTVGRGAVGIAKSNLNRSETDLSTAQQALSKMDQDVKDGKISVNSPEYQKQKKLVEDQKAKVELAKQKLGREEFFQKNFTVQGSWNRGVNNLKSRLDYWTGGQVDKKRTENYVGEGKLQRAYDLAKNGNYDYLAAIGEKTFADLRREDFASDEEYVAALNKRKADKQSELKTPYYQPSSNGDKRRSLAKMKKEAISEVLANADGGKNYADLTDDEKMSLTSKMSSEQKTDFLKYIDDAINGPGGLGELQNDIFVQSFLKQKDAYARLSKEAKEKFEGDDDNFGQYAHMLPDDILSDEIDKKGSDIKTLNTLSRSSRGNSKLLGAFDQKFGQTGYLRKKLGNDSIPDNGPGVAITSGVIGRAKSILEAEGNRMDNGSKKFDSNFIKKANGTLSRVDSTMAESYAEHIKNALASSTTLDGDSGRITLDESQVAAAKDTYSTNMFGIGSRASYTDLADDTALNAFLGGTELGQKLTTDEDFNRITNPDDKLAYANIVRKSLFESYNSKENDDLLMTNIKETARVLGSDQSINAQIDAGANSYKAAMDGFAKSWKVSAGPNQAVEQGSLVAAKYLADNGNQDQAIDVIAAKSLTKEISKLASGAVNDPIITKIANDYISNVTKLQSNSDPAKTGVLVQAIQQNIQDLKQAKYMQRGFDNKIDSVKQVAQQATAHIEAKKIQEKLNTREGLTLQDASGNITTIKKSDLAKIASTEEVYSDVNEYLATGGANIANIKERLNKKGVSAAGVAKYENMLQVGLGGTGKIDGRGGVEREKASLDHLFGAVKEAQNQSAVAQVLSQRKKELVTHTSNVVSGFHKSQESHKAVQDLVSV